MTNRSGIFDNIDKTVLFLFLLMTGIGWVNIFSAEYSAPGGQILDLSASYGKQMIWIGTAMLAAAAILIIDVRFFTNFAWVIYVLTILALVAVLIWGTEINATRAWFRVGGLAIQPSEFAKYGVAMALASFIGSKRIRKTTNMHRARAFLIILLPAVLVLLQKDVGTTLVFASFVLVLFREGFVGRLTLFFLGLAIFLFILTLMVNEFIIIGSLAIISIITGTIMKKKHAFVAQLTGLFLLTSAYVLTVDYAFENVLQSHHKARIEVLVYGDADLQGAGYNLHQSKIAIGSGGLAGKGFLQGTQTQFNFIPEQSTDFIFCTIGEEWGFAGSFVVIGLFSVLLLRLITLAERQKSTFSRIIGYSTISVIFTHFAINIGMTIGLVPVIGIPLPLISYGGSSLWALTLLLFTFLKLDARRMDMN